MELTRRKIKLNKENLSFILMGIFAFLPLILGFLAWYCFDFSLNKQAIDILKQKEVEFDQEINPDDLSQINKIFLEKRKRYEKSNTLEFREIFN